MSAQNEPTKGRTVYRREGPVAIIELNNPPLNVVSLAMTNSLDRHVTLAAEDPSVRGASDGFGEPGVLRRLRHRRVR
jgi:enoyl-CoA hydratase